MGGWSGICEEQVGRGACQKLVRLELIDWSEPASHRKKQGAESLQNFNCSQLEHSSISKEPRVCIGNRVYARNSLSSKGI